MPNIQCLCGNLITLGAIPSPNKYFLMPDVALEDFIEDIKADCTNEEHIFDRFYKVVKDLIKCSNCNRLWIDEKNNGEYQSYVPEE